MPKNYKIELNDKLELHEKIIAKLKNKNEKNWNLKILMGEDYYKKAGEWRPILRIIDRKNNRYEEKIVRNNGDVVRYVKEKLTEHQGHGSAKKQRRGL